MTVTLTPHQLDQVNKLALEAAGRELPLVDLAQMRNGTLAVTVDGRFAGYVLPEPSTQLTHE